MSSHFYKTTINWTGNLGTGTSSYKAYGRNHEISADDKPTISASSDPTFRGDRMRYNPEELFVSSISSCHMLWYLHLCSEAGIIVIDYSDNATGIMREAQDGSGKFIEVTLHPAVIVSDASMIEKANALHHNAHEMCFIANSCNFPILHKPTCTAQST